MEAHASPSSLPRNNEEYGSHEYWENRFAAEESFEWLLSYDQLATQLDPLLQSACRDESQKAANVDRSTIRILIVGCGNAPFSFDLYNAGYTNITNIDYSETVIQTMQRRHANLTPPMEWLVMDMTTLSNESRGSGTRTLESESYHVVIDKAAMDALMTKERDVWNPTAAVVDLTHAMCTQISRVLRPKGVMIQISLTQPHFRIKYLLGQHYLANHDDNDNDRVVGDAAVTDATVANCQQTTNGDDTGEPTAHGQQERKESDDPNYSWLYHWTVRSEAAGSSGDGTATTSGGGGGGGCFGHFLYIMTKSS